MNTEKTAYLFLGMLMILFFTFLLLLFFGCAYFEDGVNYDYQQTEMEEPIMENFLNVELQEMQNEECVFATVTFKPDSEIPTFHHAEMYIDGKIVSTYIENKFIFIPEKFGEIQCMIDFYDNKREPITSCSDTLNLSIKSFYIGAHADLGHRLKQIPYDGKNVQLVFGGDGGRGNNDICFRMVFRVPDGKKINIDYTIDQCDDPRPKYNRPLEIHFRGKDYAYREDWYDDEAFYFIDNDREKWIPEPVELGHGVHVLYICPSNEHDKSYLTIQITGDYVGTVSGLFKTIFDAR